jgi:PmbA protein
VSDELLAIADSVLARAHSGEEVEVFAARATETVARAREGVVETLEQAKSGGVGVRVVVDGRQGFASVGSLDPDAIAAALDDARDNASFATADDANGVAVPDGVEAPAMTLFDREIAEMPVDRKIELALALEAAGLRVPGVTSMTLADYSDTVVEKAIVTTTGIRVTDAKTVCAALGEALASNGDDRFEAYAQARALRFADLDVEETGRLAAERAATLLGATKPKSARVTIVFDPDMTAEVLEVIGSTLTGSAVLKGRSLFAERVGDQVAVPAFTLVDDATDVRSTAASRFDGEGLASRRTSLIDGGVLQGFLHASWSARKAKTASTASAARGYSSTPSVSARALQLSPGTLSDAELLAAIGDGIYVQSMSGLHSGVNPVSGDFSVGMTGRVIRGGQLAEPVREATIASTIQRMLLDVVAIGGDVQWAGSTGAPMLAIEGVSLSGS